MGVEQHGISRRDFLKLSGAFVGTIVLSPLLKKFGPEILSTRQIETESANTVSFRKDGVMEVNNEPVFPLGLYYLPGPEGTASWEKLKNAGLNTINQWYINDWTIDKAEKNNIYTIAYLPYAFPWIDSSHDINKENLSRLKKSKSFIGYYGADEPDLTLKRPLRTSYLKELEGLDPEHPGMVVFAETPNISDSPPFDISGFKEGYPEGNREDLEGLPDSISVDDFKAWYIKKSGIEIVSFDYYDPGNIVGVDGVTKKYIGKLRSGEFGPDAKSVWVTLSAHSEIPRTLKSMRFQAIDVIARGATGILWWDWPDDGYSVHWEKIQSIGRELAGVKKGLVGKEMFLGINQSGNVACKVTESDEGRHYIFAVANFIVPGVLSKEKIPVSLRNKNFLVLGENRIVTSDKDGNLEDNYGYLYARIYVQLVDMY